LAQSTYLYILEPSAHRPVGMGPKKDHEKEPRPGTPLLRGKMERVAAVQSGEQNAAGRPCS